MRIVLAVFACLLGVKVHAAVPDVALIDRSIWPERLESPALFDVASRAEILGFARALWLSEQQDEEALKARLGLRYVNMASINLLRHRLWVRLLENFRQARVSCTTDANFCVYAQDMEQLRQRAEEFSIAPDSFYAAWGAPSALFHRQYLDELLYKAALFPQTSSEIARYNSDELTGDDMPDRSFMLNFEGGPSPVNGDTDWLADFMRQQKMTATFFVLGKPLQARLNSSSAAALQNLYRQQCVGIQGWEYRSHSQWRDWQGSVQRSADLVERILPDSMVPLFRPPYGHRRPDSGEFFRAQDLRVSLWTIDAQDNLGRLNSAQISDRVQTLMLLWRKGTVVFHDTGNRAQSALPLLLANSAQSELTWEDCRTIERAPEDAQQQEQQALEAQERHLQEALRAKEQQELEEQQALQEQQTSEEQPTDQEPPAQAPQEPQPQQPTPSEPGPAGAGPVQRIEPGQMQMPASEADPDALN